MAEKAKKTTVKATKSAAAKPAVKKAVAKKVAPKKEVVGEIAAPVVETTVVAPEAVTAPAAKPAATASATPEFNLQEMLELGCHFGHKASKWHPKMAEYIYGEKDGIHLFDLPKVATLLQEAYAYVYKLGQEGKSFVMVGTKKQAREVVKEAATTGNCFFINARWMGGLLTNWPQVSKSIKRMEEIREGLATDKYKGYTKYERVQLEKEQLKLERFFGGLRGLKNKPDCIMVIDPKKEHITVAEANNVGVPVIALTDSDSDPRPVQFVIPGNDDALKSIKFFVDHLAAAYQAGRAARS